MSDGTGQPVQHGFLILMDMRVTVGNAVGMEIGMVVNLRAFLVRMTVLVVMGRLLHERHPLSLP